MDCGSFALSAAQRSIEGTARHGTGRGRAGGIKEAVLINRDRAGRWRSWKGKVCILYISLPLFFLREREGTANKNKKHQSELEVRIQIVSVYV